MMNKRIVPLQGSIEIKVPTGTFLRAIYPNMALWQKALIKTFLLLERIKEAKRPW